MGFCVCMNELDMDVAKEKPSSKHVIEMKPFLKQFYLPML